MLLALATLAHAYKDRVRVCALEVHGQSKNQTFGFNSRVLRFPDSRRRGARSRPVLACGHPYPAVTVHGVPELHARALFAGVVLGRGFGVTLVCVVVVYKVVHEILK